MSDVKMPDPFGWITRESYFGLKAVPLHATSSAWSKTPLFTADQMEAYADAKVREALETVKRGCPGKYSDIVSDGGMDPRNRPAPGAQEGA